MKRKNSIVFLLFFLFVLLGVTGETVTVGISGSSPFHISGTAATGISLDIWQEIANRENIQFTLKEFNTISNLIDAVHSGKVDIGIGPISITSERIQKVEFTQPYYSSHKAILVQSDSVSIFNAITPFLEIAFFYGIAVLIFLLFIVGNLVWIFEKKENPAFQFPYLQSIGNGMWLSIVTFTTVGYGDISVKTKAGRFVISIWMITSMITASSLTAGIATSFTVATLNHFSITSLKSIRDRNIAAIIGSDSELVVKQNYGKLIQVKNLSEGINKIKNREVDALISDYPILKYNLIQEEIENTKLIEIYEDKDNYGICTAINNPLLKRINESLLILEEEGKLFPILTKWGL